MNPSGAHTHPELRGSGGGNGWRVVLGAVVLAAIVGPVARAVTGLIEVLAIAVAVVLAVVALAAVLAHPVRRRSTGTSTQRLIRELPGPPPRPLGRARDVHLHFYGLSAEDVAAIIASQDKARDLPGSIHGALSEPRE